MFMPCLGLLLLHAVAEAVLVVAHLVGHPFQHPHDLIPLIDLRRACTKVKRLPLSKVDRLSAKAAYCVNKVEMP